ncbi:MAG: hypothetical protein ACP5QT_04740 [Brevinematia bacterium]
MLKKYISCLLLVFTLNSFMFSLENNTNITQKDIEEWIQKSKTVMNPDLFYNIGIFYSSIRNNGKAILYLKKAYLLSHNDRKIKEALENERKKLDLPFISTEPSAIEKIFAFPFNFAPLNILMLFGLILYSTGSILIFLNLFKLKRLAFLKKYFEGKAIIITGIILFILGLTYLSVSIFKYRLIFNKREAVIIEDGSLFDRPESNSIVISKVVNGTECGILSEDNGYYLVNTFSGKEGYVITNIVERLW